MAVDPSDNTISWNKPRSGVRRNQPELTEVQRINIIKNEWDALQKPMNGKLNYLLRKWTLKVDVSEAIKNAISLELAGVVPVSVSEAFRMTLLKEVADTLKTRMFDNDRPAKGHAWDAASHVLRLAKFETTSTNVNTREKASVVYNYIRANLLQSIQEVSSSKTGREFVKRKIKIWEQQAGDENLNGLSHGGNWSALLNALEPQEKPSELSKFYELIVRSKVNLSLARTR